MNDAEWMLSVVGVVGVLYWRFSWKAIAAADYYRSMPIARKAVILSGACTAVVPAAVALAVAFRGELSDALIALGIGLVNAVFVGIYATRSRSRRV